MKIVPVNKEDTVTINVHRDKRIYAVRYYSEEERMRRGVSHSMTVFRFTDAAIDAMERNKEHAAEKLEFMSIGMDVDEKFKLDDDNNFLVLDSQSGMCHLRQYYKNDKGEMMPTKKGTAVTPPDLMEIYEALPVCVALKNSMD